ncbi:hypothetical protein SAMN02745977_01543 [Brachymonas denitrificans DSM 15123]|uniref:Uncharacterized protein n=1 Tax=Brachymonas denitrificans DSM 15123 TaxID=1121117 RepID=A0A1H8HN25_9BURK|nr:hypothetical protein SAMN02745977_01543 [Brachymonas denitrificans DSM 15123]
MCIGLHDFAKASQMNWACRAQGGKVRNERFHAGENGLCEITVVNRKVSAILVILGESDQVLNVLC